jgi:hypothetical protein
VPNENWTASKANGKITFGRELTPQEKAKQLITEKGGFSRMTRADKDELLLALAKMNGLISE